MNGDDSLAGWSESRAKQRDWTLVSMKNDFRSVF